MDWASGHWPGIVPVCVWMRASCLGWGVALWVRGAGIMVTGCETHQDPCAPLGGDTWPRDPLTDLHTAGRQFTHQPSSLTPRWQLLARCPPCSVRQKRWNQLICHQCVLCFVFADDAPLGIIKLRLSILYVIYSTPLYSACFTPCFSHLFDFLLFCTLLPSWVS